MKGERCKHNLSVEEIFEKFELPQIEINKLIRPSIIFYFNSRRSIRNYINKFFPHLRFKYNLDIKEDGEVCFKYALPSDANDCEKCFLFFIKTRKFFIRRWKNGYVKKENWYSHRGRK